MILVIVNVNIDKVYKRPQTLKNARPFITFHQAKSCELWTQQVGFFRQWRSGIFSWLNHQTMVSSRDIHGKIHEKIMGI